MMLTNADVVLRWENGREDVVGRIDMRGLGEKILMEMDVDNKLCKSLIAAELTREAVRILEEATKDDGSGTDRVDHGERTGKPDAGGI